jgi:hypothetical protein
MDPADERGSVRMAASDEPLWWQRGVVYQVYPRSFRHASGDGTGDLAGVTEKLPYLADVLGVDAVWLTISPPG